MSENSFSCKQCGECCKQIGLSAIHRKDILRWGDEERWDILERIEAILGQTQVEFDWINPKTMDACSRCPWLRKLPNQDKYICRIQETKPEACAYYHDTEYCP